MKVCDIKGCGKPYHANGLCNSHYKAKWWKDGNPRKTNPWTKEVKALVADMLLEELSATQIAARLRPAIQVSRNAVIGVVARDPVLSKIRLRGTAGAILGSKQSRLPGPRTAAKKRWQKCADAEKAAMKREMTANKRAAGIPNISGASVDRSALILMAQIPDDTRDLTARLFGDPLPGRRAIDKAHGRAIPMVELKPGECKFPVNEAEPGEMHLFCGLRANPDKPYCATHAFLAYRQQIEHRHAA